MAAQESAPSEFAGWIAALPERQRLAVFLRYQADQVGHPLEDRVRTPLGLGRRLLAVAQRPVGTDHRHAEVGAAEIDCQDALMPPLRRIRHARALPCP